MRQIIFLFIFIYFKAINSDDDDDEINTEVQVENTSVGCNEDIIMNYLAEIEVTSPENLIEQVVANFVSYCRRLEEQLTKFRAFSKTCQLVNPKDLYPLLMNAAKTLYKKLCDSPEFLKRFELYYPCIQELRKDVDGCDGTAEWYHDNNETEVCKSYKHIIDCYYTKIAKVCGIEAAKTIKTLALDVMDNAILIKCDNVCADPEVKDPMPAKYLGKADTIQSSIKIITIFTILKFYLI